MSRYLFIVMLLVISSPLTAKEESKLTTELPIKIEADSVDLNEQKGISVYRGNVKIVQGDLSIHAEKLTVYIKQGKIDYFLAKGKPVKVKRDNVETPMRAEAAQVAYYASEGRVLAEGDAHLWHGLNEFSGSRIEYFVNKDQITADRGKNGGKRVKVILHPEKDQNKDTGQ